MEEHAFKKIQKDLSGNRIGSIVLLFGKEQYLVSWARDLLIRNYVNEATREIDLSIFDASSAVADDVMAACETIAMLSAKRVVVVRYGKERSKVNEKELVSYLPHIPGETLLILEFQSEPKKGPLMEAVLEFGSVYDFSTLDQKTLRKFIDKRLKVENKVMSQEAYKEFIFQSGYLGKDSDYSIYAMVNDIARLAAFSEGDSIEISDVEEFSVHSVEKNIFTLTDYIGRGKKGDAIKVIKDLLDEKVDIMKIIGTIVSQYELIYSIKELKAESMNNREIIKMLKVHEYRYSKVAPVADRYSKGRLKNILLKAYELESNIKSGILSDQLALELFAAEV